MPQHLKLFSAYILFALTVSVMTLPATATSPLPPKNQPRQAPTESLSKHMKDMDIAVLRSIDKTYARTSTFEVPVGQTVKFGNSLFIRPQACRKTPPTKRPESAAFLQIWERIISTAAQAEDKPRSPNDTKWVFSGWMFASSPALSAMNHPVFDVWLIDCKKSKTSDSSEEHLSDEAPPETKADSASE